MKCEMSLNIEFSFNFAITRSRGKIVLKWSILSKSVWLRGILKKSNRKKGSQVWLTLCEQHLLYLAIFQPFNALKIRRALQWFKKILNPSNLNSFFTNFHTSWICGVGHCVLLTSSWIWQRRKSMMGKWVKEKSKGKRW